MVDQQQDFSYHHIVLFKSQTLGAGSYGGVCKAECDGLLCAAKIMHPTLFDLRDPGTTSYLRKFEEECRLLSLARHPNIVQYLATYCDPETHLPVLLMELCDESLCSFLERSVEPLFYHTELNISHDIALALVYLHTNGLIHRDLTGNNVLITAGVRAKVTDFGMSKLASVNPRMTPLTFCPGNFQYMPPEALEEPPSYTNKLDIFSFGVLQVQLMTRQFPDPGPRFQVIDVPDDPRFPEGTARVPIPETQRRSAHLQLISSSHPLKPIALNCLKGKEKERPSALQLSSTLSNLKQAHQYAQSLQQTQTGETNRQELESLRKQVQDLQQHDQEREQEILQQRVLSTAMGREMQQLQSTVEMNERAIQEMNHTIRTKERELQASKHLVAQLQQSLEQKDKANKDLQQAISAHERNIQQLEQHVRTSNNQHQQLPEMSQATGAAVQQDITKLRWEEGKRAPEQLYRGASVIDGNTVYINSNGSHKVYSCQILSDGLLWSTLPDSRYELFSLAVINGLLTCIGGSSVRNYSNDLYTLTGEGRRKLWSEVFPPMPTARSQTASVATEQGLVVAGGWNGKERLDTVEVMNISTKQWATAKHLPRPFAQLSGAICGDQLYLGGGYIGSGKDSKSVLTCSMPDLLQSHTLAFELRTISFATNSGLWHEIRELPVTLSTLNALGGHLIAVGGKHHLHNPTADVHLYNHRTDSWQLISKMKNKQYQSLSAVIPHNQLLVLGGLNIESSSSVEIGSLPVGG